MNIHPNNKEECIQFVADWKQTYKALSQQIRNMKRSRKDAVQEEFPKLSQDSWAAFRVLCAKLAKASEKWDWDKAILAEVATPISAYSAWNTVATWSSPKEVAHWMLLMRHYMKVWARLKSGAESETAQLTTQPS